MSGRSLYFSRMLLSMAPKMASLIAEFPSLILRTYHTAVIEQLEKLPPDGASNALCAFGNSNVHCSSSSGAARPTLQTLSSSHPHSFAHSEFTLLSQFKGLFELLKRIDLLSSVSTYRIRKLRLRYKLLNAFSSKVL